MADKILNPKTGRMVSITGKIGKAIAAATGVAPEGKIYNPKTKRFVKATPKRVKEASVAKMASRPAPKKIDPEIEAYERKVFELENELFKLRKIRDETLAMAEKISETKDEKFKKSLDRSRLLEKEAEETYKMAKKRIKESRTLAIKRADVKRRKAYEDNQKRATKIKELLDIVEQTDKKIVAAEKELKSLVKPLTSKAKEVAKKIPEDILNRILAIAGTKKLNADFKNIPPAVLAKLNEFTAKVPKQYMRYWKEFPKILNKYSSGKGYRFFEENLSQIGKFDWDDEDVYFKFNEYETLNEKILEAFMGLFGYAIFLSETERELRDGIAYDGPFSGPEMIYVNIYGRDDEISITKAKEIRDEMVEEIIEDIEDLPKPIKNLLAEDSDEEDENNKEFFTKFFNFIFDNAGIFDEYYKVITEIEVNDDDDAFDRAVEEEYERLKEDLDDNEEFDEDELREQARENIDNDFDLDFDYEIFLRKKD